MLLGQTCNSLVGLGNLGAYFSAVELNVAVRGDVRSDATVGSVGSSATSDGALNGNMGDHALLDVQTLGLSVALQIQQQLTDRLGRLSGPPTVAPLVLSNLGVSGNVAVVSAEWDDLLVSKHSLHVLDCLSNFHALNVSGSFEGVLKVSSKVCNLGFSG